MANFNNSPNMSLPIPAVGIDPGPDYATNINQCLTILDTHNHAPGYGVQINPDGMNINADLAFNDNNLTGGRSLRLQIQPALLAGPNDLACFYSSGVDAYFNDGNGNQVRLTQNGAVSGTPGSIANLVTPASASYNSGTSTFIWQSNSNTAANMDAASYILRNLTANSKGLTLSPPTAMGSDYTITLPPLPASTLPISITSSGVMGAAPLTFSQLDAAAQLKLNSVAPTIQKFLTGSGTYTLPVSPRVPLYIRVTAVGAGGGGGGSGFGAGSAGDGSDTAFGTTLIISSGGKGGKSFDSGSGTGSGGLGGAATLGSGPLGLAFQGSAGNGGSGGVSATFSGGSGGATPLGGAGGTTGSSGSGGGNVNAIANTGSGAAGGSGGGDGFSGGGGGAGGYVNAIITSPASTYTYSIGTGGTAGSGVTASGGTGADGMILVEEFYQ